GPFRSSLGSPLLCEHGVDDLVGPLPFHELVLYEVCFLAHPQTLHDRHRGGVAAVAAGHDSVESQPVEGEPEPRSPRLGGVAAALVVRVDGPAHLALATGFRPVDERDVAHHRSPGLRGEDDRTAFLSYRHLLDALP